MCLLLCTLKDMASLDDTPDNYPAADVSQARKIAYLREAACEIVDFIWLFTDHEFVSEVISESMKANNNEERSICTNSCEETGTFLQRIYFRLPFIIEIKY